MSEGTGGRVVVGLDGSDVSKVALRWALRYASRNRAAVDVVIAWNFPTAYEWGPVMIDNDFEAVARKVLSNAVDEVVGDFPDVAVEQVAVRGGPGAVLIERSRGASMLVVGSRGHHGGLVRLLRSSVSQQCAHHAVCPVVVIRPDGQVEQAA